LSSTRRTSTSSCSLARHWARRLPGRSSFAVSSPPPPPHQLFLVLMQNSFFSLFEAFAGCLIASSSQSSTSQEGEEGSPLRPRRPSQVGLGRFRRSCCASASLCLLFATQPVDLVASTGSSCPAHRADGSSAATQPDRSAFARTSPVRLCLLSSPPSWTTGLSARAEGPRLLRRAKPPAPPLYGHSSAPLSSSLVHPTFPA